MMTPITQKFKDKGFSESLSNWMLPVKMTIMFTLLCCFQVSAFHGYAQNITIRAKNTPLIKVMQSIQAQHGIPFLLNGKDISKTTLSAEIVNTPLDKALDQLLIPKSIDWEMVDGTLILKRATAKNKVSNSTNSHAAQQSRTLQGRVTDPQGNPIAGATVVIVGTNAGATSDGQGNFSIEVRNTPARLQVRYIGYETAEMTISNQTTVQITLTPANDSMEEVVVVGYGTLKKKLTTGSTIQVKGDDLTKLSTPNILESLQSQAPGVQITQNSGMPGESFKVTIRGLGTIGNSSPLYVIDGIPGGSIDMLNPSDIESIDILKDAASAAIYGSRAANGVVLVTTKQGKSGRTQVHLDNYVGFQNAYKLPSLLTAKEYMIIQDERRFNEGAAPYDWATLIPKQYQQIEDGTWNGTNWLKEISNKDALLQNLSFNMMGGNEQSKFSIGYSLSNRDGIMGAPVEPDFQRHTARINSEHILYKNDRFDVIKFGENVNYSYSNRSGIGIGNIYWNDVHNMLVGNPLLPIYDSEGNFYDQLDKVADGWVLDGATANPAAEMYYRRGQNLSKNHNLSANAYLEVQPVEGLKWRTNFGYRMSASSYRQYTPTYQLSTTLTNPIDDISQNQSLGYNWVLENTLSYGFQPVQEHQLDVVIGQSIEKGGLGEGLSVTTANSSFPGQWDKAFVGNGQGYENFIPAVGGIQWPAGRLSSFFGRANYNVKETYMASFTLRADGSSNFARGNRWGYFPSASAGWILSNEPFLQDNSTIDFFKLRASWGQNGNASISPFQYLATIAINQKNGYYFGDNKSSLIRGAYPDILPNPDITWETSEQINIGFDARFVNNRLNVVFDWYKKTTKDWLVQAPVLAIFGTSAPFINGGDVENKGIEFGLNWNDNAGEFTYGVGINGAFNKNKVLRIANTEGIIHGEPNVLSQSTTEMYRAQVDYPIGYFYGYKTAGIFQNQQQIDELRAQGHGVLASSQPGDVIFVDYNGDGQITDLDKTMVGNPHPDFSGGMNLNFGYKGFDLNVTAIGSFGHQIAKSYRSFADSPLQNYTTEIFQRWHGEGTSNRYPRLTNGAHPNTLNISDIYIEDGDFVKIQNITLGYDFKRLWNKAPFAQARFYATVQNLVTFTNYSGMDPEIGYGYDASWVSGIDLGFYPQPRTVMFGLNLKF